MASRGSSTTATRTSKTEVQLGNTPMTSVNFLSKKTVDTTPEDSLSSTVFVDVNGYVRLPLVFLNMAVLLLGLLGFWSSLYELLTSSSPVPSAPSRNFVVVLFQRPEIAAFFVSSVVFVTASFGFLGALRENVTLLTVYVRLLTAFAVLQLLAAVLVFFLPSAARSYTERTVSRDMIAAYRDYPHLESFVDWMQLEYRCCGFSSEGFRDWNLNPYFACNKTNESRERCFVPASCCRRNDTNADRLPNVMCGMNVLQVSDQVAWARVYTRSCSEALFSRLQDHVLPASMIALALCLLTLLLVSLAIATREQVQALSAIYDVYYSCRGPFLQSAAEVSFLSEKLCTLVNRAGGLDAPMWIERLEEGQEVMEARNTSGFREAKARRASRGEEPPANFWGLLRDK